MNDIAEARYCRCSWILDAIESVEHPIVVLDKSSSCWIKLNDSQNSFVPIHYCPNCGGKLPDRLKQAAPINECELQELKELCEQISNLDEMKKLLGEPDRVFERDGVVSQYNYSSKWKTVKLVLFGYVSGKILFSWSRNIRDNSGD